MESTILQPFGNYPDEWQKIDFDHFATLKRGQDLTRERFRDGMVPVAGSNGVIGYHDTANVKGPGVTVGRSGSVGRVNFYAQDFWAHNTALFVTDFHSNDPLFTSYFLSFLKLERFGSGVSVPTLDRNVFRTLPVVVPQTYEQRKIAGVLGVVQRAMEQQDRLLALTAELKKTLLHQLFTAGLRGETQKETDLGPMPASWEERALEEAGDVVYGIQAAVAANLKPIGTKILTNKNIKLNGELVLDSINYFVLKTKRHHETVLKKGDLLFNWRSGSKEHVGKTAQFDLDGEFTHSSFILRIRPHDDVTGRYLFYYLNFLRESGYFVKSQTFSVNAKFNKSAINRLPTYLPGEDERREIVTTLDAVAKKIAGEQVKKKLLEELFRTLLHQLMTAQIRVHDLDLDILECGDMSVGVGKHKVR
jgi:type I restriction enzyme S subunit